MRLCVLDGHTLNPGDNPWDELASLGELAVYDRTAENQIIERAAGADILLTNKTLLSASTIEQLSSVRQICVLATGVNVVDLAAARARGIAVCNVPEYGTASVAQHVFALLLELAEHVAIHDAAVRAGEWIRSIDFSFWRKPPLELASLTMGIVGYGRIGEAVGSIARAFGMKVIAAQSASPFAPPTDPSTVDRVPIDQVFAGSDVVSLHCPLTNENRGLVDARRLALMKPTAYLINTARGALVDEQALASALRAGALAGAGLDVVSAEPMHADNPLLGVPNCIITPHIAWASLAARRRLLAATVDNVRAFLAGTPQNLVA